MFLHCLIPTLAYRLSSLPSLVTSLVCVCNKIPVSDEPAGGDDAHSKGGDTVYDAAGRDVYMYTMIVMVTVMVITKLMMIVIMSRAGF